jgi:hypothetical protein
MTTTYSPTSPTLTEGLAGIYRPGHYETDHDRGEHYVSAQYHVVDVEPRADVAAYSPTLCGWQSERAEYAYDLNGSDRSIVCPACIAVLDARAALDAVEPDVMLADVERVRAGALNVDDVEHVAAGRAAVRAASTGTVHAWHLVTVGMILSYWQHRHAAYWSDLLHVSRSLTAAARARGWQHHYSDYVGALDDLPSVMRVTAERAEWFPASSGPGIASHLSTTAPIAPPRAIADIRPGTTVADICAAVRALEALHVDTLQAIGDAFLEAADDNEWCTDYERAVLDVVDGLSDYVRHDGAFRGREREREYSVELTVTESRTVWVTVTASDEDSAADYAVDNWQDYDDGDRYSVSVDDVSVDSVSDAS